eukprot:471743-Pelagomonas_calceolata.AAC.3
MSATMLKMQPAMKASPREYIVPSTRSPVKTSNCLPKNRNVWAHWMDRTEQMTSKEHRATRT